MIFNPEDIIDLNIPKHIGIILDGNGRWATKKGLSRPSGHVEGAKRVHPICKAADELGVEYLTLYAFSTENWKRSQLEVGKIMELLYIYVQDFYLPILDNNMRFRVIGDRAPLSKGLNKKIDKLEASSKDNTGLFLQVAINYGGRNEIVRAFNKILAEENYDLISEAILNNYLDTSGTPDTDLIIRTGGDQRISNFLLWQSAYSELYFTDKLWPDFYESDLLLAIKEYSRRNRRFGKA